MPSFNRRNSIIVIRDYTRPMQFCPVLNQANQAKLPYKTAIVTVL